MSAAPAPVSPSRFAAEPWRLFFPLGVVLAWAGVSHWLFVWLGVVENTSSAFHAIAQDLLRLDRPVEHVDDSRPEELVVGDRRQNLERLEIGVRQLEQDAVDGQYRILADFCGESGLGLMTARDEEERDLLWEIRRSVSPSLARRGVTKVNEDVSLPLGRLEEGVSIIHGAARELELDCYIFGHCGDGNLHVNVMTDRRRKEEMKRVELFVDRLFEWVAGVGGTLSGEHGVGLTKKSYLGSIFSPRELAFQGAIRRAMDGTGLMNRGKYFTPEGDSVHR